MVPIHEEDPGDNGGGNGIESSTAGGQTVPFARFHGVIGERDAARAQVADLQTQLAQASNKAATVDQLTAQVTSAQAGQAAAEARFGSYQTIAGRGITDATLVAAIEQAHAGLPKRDRPELGAWIDAFRPGGEDAEADAARLASAPVLLRPHFEAAWSPDTGQSQQRRGGHAGRTHQPASGKPISAESIFDLARQRQTGEITQEQYDAATARRG